MVLIHLAKIDLLEDSCDYFTNILIPNEVKEEVLKGSTPDKTIIESLIANKKIVVKHIKNKNLIKKANEFNIYRGEAEALALYWELKADLLATDDDNVRKKREILRLQLIGTPAIILKLYKDKKIDKNKTKEAIKKLRHIGWFSSTIFDKMIMEVET